MCLKQETARSGVEAEVNDYHVLNMLAHPWSHSNTYDAHQTYLSRNRLQGSLIRIEQSRLKAMTNISACARSQFTSRIYKTHATQFAR